MKYLLENEQAKKIDEFAIKNLGVPSIVLMENAARSCAKKIISLINKNDKILILCGIGNNGGDGLAIARHLFNLTYANIDIYIIGDITKQSQDNKTNFNILKNMKIDVKILNDDEIINIHNNYDIIIDAVLGIGAKNELKGIFSLLINTVNNFSGIKIAIDLPTGLDSDNGYADSNAFKADYTITMFSPKVGLYINDGKNYTGKIIEAYLGVSNLFLKDFSKNYILEFEDLKNLLPVRKTDSSKFDYGRILIIAGSEKYSGAAALTANACIKAGAGLVELFSNKFHPSLFAEIIQIHGKSNHLGSMAYENIEYLLKNLAKYDAIAIGPGLSNDIESNRLVQELLYQNLSKKIIIDADGLKAIIPKKALSPNIILTPHIYEFINTFRLEKKDVLKNPYFYAKMIAKEYNCVVLLKGTPTIITNGEVSFFNIYGNNGMATAGSGDVLTGIISYYATQADNLLVAGAIGSFIHSKAGDNYAQKYNCESLTASEIINSLKEIRIDYTK